MKVVNAPESKLRMGFNMFGCLMRPGSETLRPACCEVDQEVLTCMLAL